MNTVTTHPKLSYASSADGRLKRTVIRAIEKLTGQRMLEDAYTQAVTLVDAGETTFWEAALQQLHVHLAYDAERLAMIPREGPLVVVANHPFGVLDGLTICHLTSLVRPNFKILVHKALCREPYLAPYLLPIDFAETEAATRNNLETKRSAIEWLKQGNALILFPAGGISTTVKGPFGPAVDLDWKLFCSKLIQQSRATVAPFYFHGQNSRLFQLVSQFSLTLRLSLIIHEVKRMTNRTLHVSVGEPIAYSQLAHLKDRRALTEHLRRVTYQLGGRSDFATECQKFVGRQRFIKKVAPIVENTLHKQEMETTDGTGRPTYSYHL